MIIGTTMIVYPMGGLTFYNGLSIFILIIASVAYGAGMQKNYDEDDKDRYGH